MALALSSTNPIRVLCRKLPRNSIGRRLDIHTAFHTTSRCSAISIFNMAAASHTREQIYLSKAQGRPPTEFSSQLELIKTSEVLPFQRKDVVVNPAIAKQATMQTKPQSKSQGREAHNIQNESLQTPQLNTLIPPMRPKPKEDQWRPSKNEWEAVRGEINILKKILKPDAEPASTWSTWFAILTLAGLFGLGYFNGTIVTKGWDQLFNSEGTAAPAPATAKGEESVKISNKHAYGGSRPTHAAISAESQTAVIDAVLNFIKSRAIVLEWKGNHPDLGICWTGKGHNFRYLHREELAQLGPRQLVDMDAVREHLKARNMGVGIIVGEPDLTRTIGVSQSNGEANDSTKPGDSKEAGDVSEANGRSWFWDKR